MKESHLKNALVISTGVETALASLVLIFMFYMWGTWQSLVGGGLGLITFSGGIAVSLWCFYQERSGRFQEFMHVACFLLAMCILGLVDPTPAFPSIPVWVKMLIMATLYGVCLTFGTRLVPDERLDKNERMILKGIQAVTSILVMGFTLYFTFHWYEHSWKALLGVAVAILITVILAAVFLYEESDSVVVGIECLLLAGLGGLVWWAKPNLSVDPGFFFLKKAILAIFVQIGVSFALIFAEDLGLGELLSEGEREEDHRPEAKHEPDHNATPAAEGDNMISASVIAAGMVLIVENDRLKATEDSRQTKSGFEVMAKNLQTGDIESLNFAHNEQVAIENLAAFMDEEFEDDLIAGT